MSSLLFLANQSLPMAIGTVGVSDQGALMRRPAARLRFAFQFAGWQFDAMADPTIDGGTLTLDSPLGPLPYSIEGVHRRVDVMAIIEASQRRLPQGRLEVDGEGRIRYRGSLTLTVPMTPVSLIAGATELLIAAQPWLSLVSLYLFRAVQPAAAAAGRALTPA